MYDFKQGFLILDGTHKLDEKSFSKIMRTLAAMPNTKQPSRGYVVVGVADKEATAKTVEALYGVSSLKRGNFYVVGIDHEIQHIAKDADEFLLKIKQKIGAENMSDEYKAHIQKEFRFFRYNGKTVLAFVVDTLEKPCHYQGGFFQRLGSNVEPIPVEQYATFFAQYAKRGLH
nr:ATP-binding protein [Roseicella aerolata]